MTSNVRKRRTLNRRAGAPALLRRSRGVCFDVCPDSLHGYCFTDILVCGNRAGNPPGIEAASVVSAHQVAGTGRGELPASTSSPSPARQKAADEAIYDVLAKQYEQFRQVNRTFRAGWPRRSRRRSFTSSARKTTRPEESRRVRQFEENRLGASSFVADHAPGLFVLTNHHVVDGSEPSVDPCSSPSPRWPSVVSAGDALEGRQS